MKRWIHVGALLSVVSFVACGGGEPADSEATDSTISVKQIKDLTADEVQSECDALASRVSLSKEDSCEFAGLMAAPYGQSCDVVKAQCMSLSEAPAQQADASCMPPTERRAGCVATVGEYEACAIAQADAIRTLTCASTLSAIDTPPPACAALTRKCPTLLEADGAGGGPAGQNPQ